MCAHCAGVLVCWCVGDPLTGSVGTGAYTPCPSSPVLFEYGLTSGGGPDTAVTIPSNDDGYQWIDTSHMGPGTAPYNTADDAAATWPFFRQNPNVPPYTGFFIGMNGIIGFSNGIPSWGNLNLPTSPSQGVFMAPFWADIKQVPGTSGVLMYRVVSTGTTAAAQTTVNQCTAAVQAGYLGTSGANPFIAKWCAIITWDSVIATGTTVASAPVNTIQAVMASDGVSTYAIFNYVSDSRGLINNGGRNWWTISTTQLNAGRIYPTVGFDAGEGSSGRSFLARPRTNSSTFSLTYESNTVPPLPGRFMYKVSESQITDPPKQLCTYFSRSVLFSSVPSALTPLSPSLCCFVFGRLQRRMRI